MTRDDIIRMAREAGFQQRHDTPREWWMLTEDIERFAALVAAAEREAILSVGKRHYDHEGAAASHHTGRFQDAYEWHRTRQGALRDLLDDIRARGESK